MPSHNSGGESEACCSLLSVVAQEVDSENTEQHNLDPNRIHFYSSFISCTG
jgi:hypothetical protein